MKLPPVQFMVLAHFGVLGCGYAGEPVETLGEAADEVSELHKRGEMYPVRVLRITETCNCDDVTFDVLDVIEARTKARAAA
jgi:hypothetical protein